MAARIVVFPAPAAPSTTTSAWPPGQCVHSVPLPGIQPLQVVDVFRRRDYWGVVLGADSEPADEVGFDVEHVPGGQGPAVFRQAGAGK